jgi:hypothetical protein
MLCIERYSNCGAQSTLSEWERRPKQLAPRLAGAMVYRWEIPSGNGEVSRAYGQLKELVLRQSYGSDGPA